MAETAAYLVEHVFPQVPVRQWVVTFPRRLRYFLHRDPVLLGRVRRSVLRTIESGLRRRCPGAPRDSRFGAVSFVQRFGSALNAHTHLHCCVTDGVFSVDAAGSLRFHPAVDLDAAAVSAVQRRIRTRVLRIAVRQDTLTPDVASDLARWGHGGGFSLHAAVRLEAEDRAGLERLLRYCARPAFASERLSWDGSDQPVRYSLTRPLPTGQTELTLTPLELLDRLAALVPPPRRHRHHYAGVFAPHARLRSRVTACAGQPVTETAPVTVPAPAPALPTHSRRRASIHWARLLARIYEIRPLTCPHCQGEMRLIAFLTDPPSIHALLAHLGEPTTPPVLAPRARAPPELDTDWDGTSAFAFDQSPSCDPTAAPPDPGFSFDQTVN
jgi:hypothetical protein